MPSCAGCVWASSTAVAFTLGDLVPVSSTVHLYSLPFVFNDADELAALRDQFDPLILDALEEGGIIAPGLALGGFAYLFAREPFPDPEAMSTSGGGVGFSRVMELSRETTGTGRCQSLCRFPWPMSIPRSQTGAINTFCQYTLRRHHSAVAHPGAAHAGSAGADDRRARSGLRSRQFPEPPGTRLDPPATNP